MTPAKNPTAAAPFKRITISELAKLSGKTPATVSRSLRGKAGVSSEVSQQIIELASQHGYVPNQIARNLVQGHSQFIGFLASDLSNPSYLHTFHILEKGSRKNGYSLLIADSERDTELERYHTEYFLKMGMAGVFIFPVSDLQPSELPRYYDLLKSYKIPAIAFGHVTFPGISTVVSEEWLSSGNLVRTLADLGHRTFVVVAENTRSNTVQAKMRLGAIRDSVANLPGGSVSKTVEFLSEHWTEKVVSALCKGSPRPTAIITINDLMALQLYRPLAEAGIAIPKDVSIAAFGNNDWAEHVFPSLSLSEADESAIAEAGVSLMMEKLSERGSPAQHLTVPQKMIIRSSIDGV